MSNHQRNVNQNNFFFSLCCCCCSSNFNLTRICRQFFFVRYLFFLLHVVHSHGVGQRKRKSRRDENYVLLFQRLFRADKFICSRVTNKQQQRKYLACNHCNCKWKAWTVRHVPLGIRAQEKKKKIIIISNSENYFFFLLFVAKMYDGRYQMVKMVCFLSLLFVRWGERDKHDEISENVNAITKLNIVKMAENHWKLLKKIN